MLYQIIGSVQTQQTHNSAADLPWTMVLREVSFIFLLPFPFLEWNNPGLDIFFTYFD